MIGKKMRKLFRILTVLLVTVLVACGGGGGSPGTTGSGGGGTGGASALAISVVLVNASGQAVTSITGGGGYLARATVKDTSGAAIINRVVTFSIDNTAIASLPETTALTDSSGVAVVPVSVVSFTASGAGTLTAKAEVTISGSTVAGTGSVDFAVAAAGLTLSPIAVITPNLPSGGNTGLSVTALVNDAPLTGTPVNVAFSVSCGRINGSDASAGGVSVTTNGSGVATATYTSVNTDGSLCSGDVNLSAAGAGAQTRSTKIVVAAPVANAVAFVSAAPSQIFVAGSGAAEQAVATFKVFAASGTPLPGVNVAFSIQENPGGVGLNASGATSNVTATTDQSGQASVSVFSGTIPGPVKVRAALVSAPSVFAESQNLTIASGPPSQRFMSLSVSSFNIEGWNVDGTPTRLTVRIADRQGNAVADGTVVNFTAEGGQVANSCATATVNKISSCSVDFVTQNPRPQGGRASVMAYLAGTKDYDDINANNIFDSGDVLKQLGDAYRDDNENNTFDVGEFVVARGGSIACPGVGGAFASRDNTCNQGLSTTVRQTAVILFASTSPAIADLSASTGSVSFSLGSIDNPLLPMPAGTTIAATPLAEGCTVGDIGGSPVVNVSPTPGLPNEDLTTNVAIALKGCAAGQRVNVKVTSPGGLVTSFPVTLN